MSTMSDVYPHDFTKFTDVHWASLKRALSTLSFDIFEPLFRVFRQKGLLAISYIRRHKKELLVLLAIAVLIVILSICLHPVLVGIVHLLGFGSNGVVAGSLAANIQSMFLGGNITPGSLFAALQSIGANGVLILL